MIFSLEEVKEKSVNEITEIMKKILNDSNMAWSDCFVLDILEDIVREKTGNFNWNYIEDL